MIKAAFGFFCVCADKKTANPSQRDEAHLLWLSPPFVHKNPQVCLHLQGTKWDKLFIFGLQKDRTIVIFLVYLFPKGSGQIFIK